MRKAILVALLFFGLSPLADAAQASISHAVRIQADYVTVQAVLAKHRGRLLRASGVRLGRHLGRGQFVVGVGNDTLTVQESRSQQQGQTAITWVMVGGGGQIQNYRSQLVLTDLGEGQVLLKGSVTVVIGRALGRNRLDAEIRGGIDRMQGELVQLLRNQAQP